MTGKCINKTVTGTELKFSLRLCLPGSLTMDDVEFTAEFYIFTNRPVSIPKQEMERQDADTYIAVIDSAALGSGGCVKCQVTVGIPDSTCPGGIRTEITTFETGEYIHHGLRRRNISQA